MGVKRQMEFEEIFIGSKEISRYISAGIFGFNKGDKIKLIARGKNIKRAIDVLAILIRDYVEKPEYKVIVDSEKFEGRNISTVEIEISGKKKEKKVEDEN